MIRVKEKMPLDALFKALGDETRREILKMLAKKEMTAGEIANVFNQSWPTISHHLKILKESGLISDEKKGLHTIFTLNTTVFSIVYSYILFRKVNSNKN